jgi:hypothetical protein
MPSTAHREARGRKSAAMQNRAGITAKTGAEQGQVEQKLG